MSIFKKILCAIAVVFVIVAYAWASNSDYEVEVSGNAYWCQMHDDGIWYSSDDEYNQRCGGEE